MPEPREEIDGAWSKDEIAAAARKLDHAAMDTLVADLERARRALRHISATADTLSPQEFINVCADGLGVDRHEYAGECDANRSLVEARVAAGIAFHALQPFIPAGGPEK